ncbi:PepSY-associated TM helix domain-containing protein [Paracidovorax anthurii]|uniref:Putative iron-regulated membrane protein n=1 Tax=Paracidovorax anthurii TaxID=78229 RepID=A0A328Z526_9BURK|nr:putative iron-regulated membrane protein [Paracidovorax anthurii]
MGPGGLACASFLIVAGLTGSLLAFGPELDAWLNPHLFRSPARGTPLPFDALVQRIEAADPRVQVDYLTVPKVPGQAAFAFVSPAQLPHRADALAAPAGFDQVFIDPVSGALLGQRQRGACCLQAENLYYFVLRVHHSLYLPGHWGWWFMGAVAIAWLLDSFVGLYLTLPLKSPLWRKWGPAWRIKAGSGAYRLNVDLHRAGGLWLWFALIALALSSVALNLKREIFLPVVSWFSPVTPTPFDTPRPSPPRAPMLSFEDARRRADAHAHSQGWSARTSGVTWVRSSGIYLALLWPSHYDRGAGLGEPMLYIDAATGQLLGQSVPGHGSAGDVFAQAQFPLHSGQMGGLPGRIFVADMGIAIAVLSITGIVIWARKRGAAARSAALTRRTSRRG